MLVNNRPIDFCPLLAKFYDQLWDRWGNEILETQLAGQLAIESYRTNETPKLGLLCVSGDFLHKAAEVFSGKVMSTCPLLRIALYNIHQNIFRFSSSFGWAFLQCWLSTIGPHDVARLKYISVHLPFDWTIAVDRAWPLDYSSVDPQLDIASKAATSRISSVLREFGLDEPGPNFWAGSIPHHRAVFSSIKLLQRATSLRCLELTFPASRGIYGQPMKIKKTTKTILLAFLKCLPRSGFVSVLQASGCGSNCRR